MWLPPSKLQRPFQVACATFTMVIFGLLIWSVQHAGGGGEYFAHDYKPGEAYGGGMLFLCPPTTRRATFFC